MLLIDMRCGGIFHVSFQGIVDTSDVNKACLDEFMKQNGLTAEKLQVGQ
jgi:hypothetical protein